MFFLAIAGQTPGPNELKKIRWQRRALQPVVNMAINQTTEQSYNPIKPQSSFEVTNGKTTN